MLSNGFARPLHLKTKPSRLLAAYLVVLHFLAVVALLQPLAVSIIIHFGLWLALIASAGFQWFHFRRQADSDNAYWIWQAGGIWRRSDDDIVYSVVAAKTVQTPWFVTVTLKCDGCQPQRLLVIRDRVDADTFRRLRVRLKLYYDEAATSSEHPV